MEVRVKCDFPYLKVMGEIKESDSCVTFRAINADSFESVDKNGEKKEASTFIFNAFGDMKERIKRLKVKRGSEITISAYMCKFFKEDEDGRRYPCYSFTVFAVDYLPTRYHKPTSSSEKEENAAEKEESSEEASLKEVATQEEKITKKIENTSSAENIDILDLEKMFG